MKRSLALGVFAVFLFFGPTMLAQVPRQLSYQGKLTDEAGKTITIATTLRFSLYQGGDETTVGSGTLVYQEEATITPDSSGVFDHLIGSGTVISGILDITVFNTVQPVYLEITVDPYGANETLLPRKQIVTVGYSFKTQLATNADKLDGQDSSAFAQVGHNHDSRYVNEGQANSINSSMIVNGTIVDADISSGANISGSKINSYGLDADLLDGKDSTDFVSILGDSMSGTLQVITTGATFSIYGKDESTSGVRYSMYGQSNSTTGRGVYGYATAITGINYGVYGQSDSTTGRSVYGYATATTGINYGVYGQSDSTTGRAVYGFAGASSGVNFGVFGRSDSINGRGVYGYATATSGDNFGVYGRSDSTSGIGVRGYAYATTGTTFGVAGICESTSGRAVYGQAKAASGINYGVAGTSASSDGRGVYGSATSSSGRAIGVHGVSFSTYGRGVYGYDPASSGTTFGVYGENASTEGYGVYGVATAFSGTTYGVRGHVNSPDGFGVYGSCATGAYAGYFKGNVHVLGTFTAKDKLCVQEIEGGKKVTLYVMESPEYWFEDFGTEQLVNGRAVVPIERVFGQTVNTGVSYFVFLTPNGECQGLYISRKNRNFFEVRELGGGTSNITFDYRVVAKRRGYENLRLEKFIEPKDSPEDEELLIKTKEAEIKETAKRP